MSKSKGRKLAEWMRNLNTNQKTDTDGIADTAITFAKLHTALVVTESDAIGSNDNDTTIATSAAIVDYVANNTPATYADSNVATYISGNRAYGNITTTGYIAGPSTFTIDPAAVGDNTGTLVIAGNLQVDGTTTTINSTTMTVDDLNITLASGAANAAAANGAGITVDGGSASFTYNGTNNTWDFNKTPVVVGQTTILRKYDSSWTNAQYHDIIYNGWTSSTGDYVYLKAPGNSVNTYGTVFVGDAVFAVGTHNSSTGVMNTSATAPIDTTWLYANSSGMTINGYVSAGNAGSGVKLHPSSATNEGAQIDLDTAGSHTGSHSIDVYAERLRFLNSTTGGVQQFYIAGNTAIGGEQAADGEWQFHKGVRIDGHDSGSGVNLHISAVNPEIRFTETDRTGTGKNYWFHHNSGSLYLLKDRTVEGTWAGPHPQRFYPDDTIDWYDEMRLTPAGDLHVNGNVIAYSTSVSDERFKDDVQPITGALDTVDALRGVTYTWNAGSRKGKRDYGVIAQEVEKVIPEIVHDTTMPLMAGDEETIYKTVDYEKLCAVLVQAVSELRAEVDALKGSI